MHILPGLPKAVGADGRSDICDLQIVSAGCSVWQLAQLVFELELHVCVGLQCIDRILPSSSWDAVLLEATVQLHTTWKERAAHKENACLR